MLNIIRKYHGLFLKYKHTTLRPIKWWFESLIIRFTSHRTDVTQIDTRKKYLILAPHSDDEWIGCSQIIIHCPHTIICNMDMPGGDSDSIHKKRFLEMLSVAKLFKKEIITISSPHSQVLQGVISNFMPDFILVPHFVDWHPEHIDVMNKLKNVIMNDGYNGAILTYQVSVPFLNHKSCKYMPMSKKEQNFKWRVFESYYKTQSFMPVARFIANEYVNGVNISENAAELYKQYSIEYWMNTMASFDSIIADRNVIKSQINNLLGIRKLLYNITKTNQVNEIEI